MQLSLFEQTITTLKIDVGREVAFDDYSKAIRLLIGLNESEIDDVVSAINLPLFMRRTAKMIKDSDKNPKLLDSVADRAYGKPRTMSEPPVLQQDNVVLERINEFISTTSDPQLLSNLLNHINNDSSHG